MPSSTAAATAVPATAPASPASREVTQIAVIFAAVIAAGSLLQIFVAPGPWALVASGGLAGAALFGLGFVLPRRLRQTLAGFRFVSVLLFALAICAVAGTLVLQGKPLGLYREKYGAFGDVIVALRLDDIFHSVWFGGLIALFFAAVLNSAILRWPIRLRNAGFFTCHVGLLTSLAGAALSTTMAVKGRVDLHAGGEHADAVMVVRSGIPTGEWAPLGFDLRLDRFQVVRYNPEYRVAYYEPEGGGWRLKASFDPDLEKHRLPGGDSFRLAAIYPDFAMRTVATPAAAGAPALQVTLGGETRWVFAGGRADAADGRVAVLFDRRLPEAPQAQTAVLVSLDERKVVVRRADGEASYPYREGLEVAGGLVRFGPMVPSAARSAEYGTRSAEMRNPAVLLQATEGGRRSEVLLVARDGGGVRLARGGALTFEHREDEVKAFQSDVTLASGGARRRATVSVNDPLRYQGWTFYQANYDPRDPTYSGLDAVKDPGVAWVFLGFFLISAGVFYMFYVETRLKGGRKEA